MIRVLIIDEVALIADVMSSILKEEADMKVVSCATTLDEALEHVEQCDIALISTTMPNSTAIELIRTLVKVNSSVKVIAIGLVESEEEVLPYVEAGIASYVLRDDSTEEMLDKIRAVHAGEASVSPEIAAALMERVAQLKELCADDDLDEAMADLTPREREVLSLLQQNVTNQEIAKRLVIEVGTVKNHVHNVLKKLNVNSRKDVPAKVAPSDC